MRFIFLLFFLISGFSIAQIKSREQIIVEFNKNKKNDSIIDFNLANSNDSWSIYKLAYSLDANNVMFKCTNDIKYINYNVRLINRLIQNSRFSTNIQTSQFKDGFKTWVNYSHSDKNYYGKEYPLFEFFAWRYVTQTLRIIKEHKLVNLNKDYNNILDFTVANIINKWEARKYNNLTNNIHMYSHFASVNYDLYKLSNNEKYLKDFNKFWEKFNSIYSIKNSNIYWKSGDTVQDVSHGNAVVGLIIRLYEDGFIDNQLINLLINTTKNKIIIGQNFSKTIDGLGIDKNKRVLTDGFMKLGKYDSELMLFFSNQKLNKETIYFRNNQYLSNQLYFK